MIRHYWDLIPFGSPKRLKVKKEVLPNEPEEVAEKVKEEIQEETTPDEPLEEAKKPAKERKSKETV